VKKCQQHYVTAKEISNPVRGNQNIKA